MRRRAWLLSCVLPACSFDGSVQPTSGSSTTLGSASDSTSGSTSDADEGSELGTSSGEAATTDGGSSGVEPTTEVCNGVDDDGDGAIDEYSALNTSCGDCKYHVTPGGAVLSYCTKVVTWAVALTRCASLGASLATIHSGAENDEIFRITTGNTAWIGLTDSAVEGTWAWHDGSPLDFTGWDAGQPNDEFGAEDCAHMREIGATWNDHVCEEVHAFICRGVP